MSQGKGRKPNLVVKMYLLMYNFAQTLGWSAIAYKMIRSYTDTGSYLDLYKEVQYFLEIFQTAALLEVVHAVLGIVATKPMLALTQISSRIFVVWHVRYAVTAQTTIAPVFFLIAWTITEIVRYSFYTIKLVTEPPYFLQWCRYTFFIILYPMGVLGELLAVYFSLPYVATMGLFSLTMPNRVNMSFSYYYVLVVIMLSYIPNFPPLYMHMLSLRKKVIGGVNPKKTA